MQQISVNSTEQVYGVQARGTAFMVQHLELLRKKTWI
jgi:hypothetical protein